jgi:integrase
MACVVKVNRHGFLAYRLFWRDPTLGRLRSWEGTRLRNTPKNREKVEVRARVMSEEMKTGTFDYLHWFKHGNRASFFRPRTTSPPPRPLTVREYAERTWLPRKQPPLVRAWCAWDYQKHLKKHILPAFGGVLLLDVTPAALERFRTALLAKPLALKTARNVIDGTFRALYRDARETDQLVQGDPFAVLKWPRRPAHKPDPFDEAERDAILEHFRHKRPHFYPFVLTAFWTGARPSELVALRWEDVDLRAGRLMIHRSRTGLAPNGRTLQMWA